MFAPQRIRIEKQIIVRIYRNLTGKGRLVVSVGQEVTPEEIIGTGELFSGFTTLNLSQVLGIAPKDARKTLKIALGKRIYKGELLAYKSAWLFSKAKFVTCPTDGILDFINDKTGEIRITRMPQKVNLPAGVYGIVESRDDNLGRVGIRTQVSRVWGIAGSGRPRDGILQILSRRSDLITKTMVNSKHHGAILLNGSLVSKEAVMMGISNGVNGIITGGIRASDYKSVAGGQLVFPKKLDNDIGISIVVCEGFGSQPMGEDIYKILSEYDDRFVTIDGNHAFLNLPSYESECMIKIKKTKLPSLHADALTQAGLVELNKGQRVRVVGFSYSSEQGEIVAIDKSKTKLSSGIFATLLTIATKRRKIQVPAQNIEVIQL